MVESRFLWRGSAPPTAFALILAANEPCLFNSRPGELINIWLSVYEYIP